MTTTTTDYEAMRAALDVDPEDWDLRLVLADLCEDMGRTDEAACLRWQVREKKRAHPFVDTWRVYNEAELTDYESTVDPPSDLPDSLFKQIGDSYRLSWKVAEFASCREADMALVDAFVKWEGKP